MAIVLLLVLQAAAQNSDVPTVQPAPDQGVHREALKQKPSEWALSGGFSPISPTRIGVSTDRKVFLLTIQYARLLAANKFLAFKYTPGLIPVALVTQPTEFLINGSDSPVLKTARTIYGAGADPLGLQLNFKSMAAVQPFLSSTGGFLYFTEQVPVTGASRFNFTFSFGAGLQIFSSRKRSVAVGYKFFHLSNNDTARLNPGIDGSLFYASYSFTQRSHK